MPWKDNVWTMDFKDGLAGLKMESRKCTNKKVKMDDVWIPKCANNSFEDLAEVVESNSFRFFVVS